MGKKDIDRVPISGTIHGTGGKVEAGATKLLKRRDEIDRDIQSLRVERDAINRALAIMGVRVVEDEDRPYAYTSEEKEYTKNHPFASKSLTDACLKVLQDHSLDWLSKAQVEYLVVCGGYNFSTKDTKNSVAVTLRRLAEDHKIDARRLRGVVGNKYRYMRRKVECADAVTDSRATKVEETGER